MEGDAVDEINKKCSNPSVILWLTLANFMLEWLWKTDIRKAVHMVVGIRRSLEEGKTYTRGELSQHLGLSGRSLEHALDHLMEQKCLKPVVFERPRIQGAPVRLTGCFEHQLSWQA